MKPKSNYIDILKQCKQKMSEKYGIVRMGIFGSVACGEHMENSDLDIYVDIQKPDAFILANIKYDLEDLIDCKVDIVRLHDNMSELLKKSIEKDGISI